MTFVKQHPAQFNNMIHDLLYTFPKTWGRDFPSSPNVPPVNIHETAEGYHLELNAPGRNKEDFKVKLEKDLLSISYEQKENTEEKNYKTIRKEFQYQSFKRSFSLDDQIQADGIQAKYEQGILRLFLPKVEKVVNSPKEISIL